MKLGIAEAQKATEQERLARLKIEERVAGRRLTEAQKARIAKKLVRSVVAALMCSSTAETSKPGL